MLEKEAPTGIQTVEHCIRQSAALDTNILLTNQDMKEAGMKGWPTHTHIVTLELFEPKEKYTDESNCLMSQ